MTGQRRTSIAITWPLAALLAASLPAAPQDPPVDHFARGQQLLEKNCGDCYGATRAGLEEAIAELRKARDTGNFDAPRLRAIHRLLGQAYGTLAHVFLPPDSEEKNQALRRQHESLEMALRYGTPETDLYVEYAATLARPQEQIPVLLDALTRDPRHADARFFLGMIFANAAENEEAIYHLRLAVEYATPLQAKEFEPRLQALLDAAGTSAPAAPPAGASAAKCSWSKFGGEVKRGEAFARPFGRNLVFYLEPNGPAESNPPGWTIGIGHRLYPRPRFDFLMPATPPYRFWNPRYLDTTYGHTAQQAVQITPREFHFFARYADLEAAQQALEKLLWSGNHSAEDVAQAGKQLAALPRFDGRVHLRDARLGGTEGGKEWIEWLKFEVEVCEPEFTPAPPAGPRTVRDLDPRELLERALRQNWGTNRGSPADCPENVPLVTVAQTLYGDLTRDGREDAVVGGYSCVSGTGGMDVFGVFRLNAIGKAVQLWVTEPRGPINGRDPHADLRGKMRLAIEDGRLAQSFPVYRKDDPNCCGSAGTRKFIYRWTGDDFVLADVVDLPPGT